MPLQSTNPRGRYNVRCVRRRVAYRQGVPTPQDMPPPGMRHMGAEVRMVIRGESLAHRLLRSRLMFLLVATLVLDVLGTAIIYALEHDDAGSGFHDWGGALFWVSAQLTTVSSQMPNPVTGWGKALDIVLEVWAITVAATLAASLAAFFRARHVEHMAGS
jgi:hypothetical protein